MLNFLIFSNIKIRQEFRKETPLQSFLGHIKDGFNRRARNNDSEKNQEHKEEKHVQD